MPQESEHGEWRHLIGQTFTGDYVEAVTKLEAKGKIVIHKGLRQRGSWDCVLWSISGQRRGAASMRHAELP